MSKNYVITIARGFGSGGKQTATQIGEKLGIPVYEKQILEMASAYSGLSEEMIIEVSQNLRGKEVTNSLAISTFPKEVSPTSKRFESDINLFCIQAEIIKQLAQNVSCVIIGKCADHILKDFDNVASFYIEAPRKECLESIMAKTGVNEKEAAKMIENTDKYRSEYYKFYSGGNYWTNPVNYDLTLNSARVGRGRCADVIIDYMRRRFGADFEDTFKGKI